MPAVHHALEVLVAVSSYSGRPRVAQQVRNRIATLLASPVPSSDRQAGDPSDTEPSNR
jgi:siroheme synthase (precorrin-2 oxidase/ferrochelatase)